MGRRFYSSHLTFVRIEVADIFYLEICLYETNWSDQLGDWNPAVTRTQGRLKPRNLLVTGYLPAGSIFSVHVFPNSAAEPVVGVKEGYNPLCWL